MSNAKTTGERAKTSQSVIVNRCPGCGGEVELRYEYDITRCTHCASLLRVENRPDLPAYFLRPRFPLHEARARIERALRSRGRLGRESISDPECWLIPYWQFQGQLLRRRVTRETIEPVSESDYDSSESVSSLQSQERVVSNVSLIPTTESGIALEDAAAYPASLTLGQQIVRRFPLVNMGNESIWQVATPRGSHVAAEEVCRQRIARNGELFEGGAVRNPTRLFVHDRYLLFVPFYSWRDENYQNVCIAIDATTGELHDSSSPILCIGSEASPVTYATELRMTAHRCSRCSADLSNIPSLVYRCDNCGHFTVFNQSSANIRTIEPTDKSENNLIWFPFWRSSDRSSDREGEIVVPSFSFRNFEVAYRISRQLRKIVRDASSSERLDEVSKLYEANVPMSACPAFLAAMQGRSAMERSGSSNDYRSPSVQESSQDVSAHDWTLLYVPFRRTGYEYTDAVISAVTFPAQALA